VDWVDWFDAHDYKIARQIVQRRVGALAFVAFLSPQSPFVCSSPPVLLAHIATLTGRSS
jgi:hypothetical protein